MGVAQILRARSGWRSVCDLPSSNDSGRSERPALTVFAMEQVAGDLRVQDLAAQRVIFDRTFDAVRKISQLSELRERAANLEIREGLTVAFARFDPFPLMALYAWERLRRASAEVFKSFLGQEHELGIPGIVGIDRSFRAD